MTVGDTEYTCTISISCASILEHMELCDKEKAELVPEDGWLLKPVEVTLQEGQSGFDVLQQVCRENKLHMEFSMTPIYNSAYIEGNGNLADHFRRHAQLPQVLFNIGGSLPRSGKIASVYFIGPFQRINR